MEHRDDRNHEVYTPIEKDEDDDDEDDEEMAEGLDINTLPYIFRVKYD